MVSKKRLFLGRRACSVDLHPKRIPYKPAAPKIYFFLPAFVARILTPRSRKSGYGLPLRCKLGLDEEHFEKKNGDVRKKKLAKKNYRRESLHRLFVVFCFSIAIDQAWSI